MKTIRYTKSQLQIDIDDLKKIVVHEWWPFIQKKYPKNQKYFLYGQMTPLKIYSNKSKKYMIFGFICTVTTYQPTGYKDPTRQLGPCWIGIEFSKRDNHWHLGCEEKFNDYMNEYLNDREAHGKNHMVDWKRIAFKANDKIALDEVDSSGISGYTLQSLNSNLLESIEKKIMKHKYTKKQITEAITYWEKQLKLMNESMGFGKKYDRTNSNLGDKYTNSAYGPSLTWGELKKIGDKAMSDNDLVDNIALICGPNDVAFGESVAYVDVDKSTGNTLVFSIAGY